MGSEGRGLSTELENGWLGSAQRFSFIAFRQWVQRYGFDSTSIRYRATASLSHPAGEISAASLKVINETPQITVDVSLMGLYGTTSPLPAFYTERILGLGGDKGDSHEGDLTFSGSEYEEGQDLKQFYDVFNHHAISLFYDSWNKYRIPSRFTEHFQSEELKDSHKQARSELSTALLAIWGIDREYLASLKHLSLPRLIPLAGLLASRCSSIDIIEQAFNQFFADVTITTRSFVGGVADVPDDQVNRLGLDNVTLGDSLVLGGQVADCSGIAVSVKLNSPDQLSQWLPEGKQNETAHELISLMLETPNDYQLMVNIGDTFEGLSNIGVTSRGLGRGVGLGGVSNAVINV